MKYPLHGILFYPLLKDHAFGECGPTMSTKIGEEKYLTIGAEEMMANVGREF